MKDKENQLIGIKAVAQYLDMSVRNVYYWEKKLGLPIHRVSIGPGRSGFRIYAYKEEIDRWLENKNQSIFKKSKSNKLLPAISILPLLLILLFFLIQTIFKVETAGPETFFVDNNIVYAKDKNGNILWSFDAGIDVKEADLNKILDIENIDDDPYQEVIACTRNIIEPEKHSITLFDHDGDVLWKRRMSTDLTFKGIKINNLFRPGPARFARTSSNEIVIVSKWNHMARFLSIIAGHNLEGDQINQYIHIGNLTHTLTLLDINGDGVDEILFTGTNNLLYSEGIVGVLPLEDFHGMCPPYRVEPEYSGSDFHLDKYIPDQVVPGNELFYLRFKRTPHLPKHRAKHINTNVIYYSDNLIQISLIPWIFESWTNKGAVRQNVNPFDILLP